MAELLSLITGYIFGSFPTAYLLLKRTLDVDITRNGSGNVGALNSYEVSKSKLLGASVFSIDFFKGLLPVLIISFFIGDIFIYKMLGLLGAVLAHCYSPWIKFKGGRGLATAAGGSFVISIPIIIIWGLIWLTAFALRRNIHFANFTATILTGVLSFTSVHVLVKYTMPPPASGIEFSLLTSLIMLIILLKHIQPIKEYFKTQNQKVRDIKDESI